MTSLNKTSVRHQMQPLSVHLPMLSEDRGPLGCAAASPTASGTSGRVEESAKILTLKIVSQLGHGARCYLRGHYLSSRTIASARA